MIVTEKDTKNASQNESGWKRKFDVILSSKNDSEGESPNERSDGR